MAGKYSSAKVLFMHGLESNSKGKKARFLRESFKNFECVDMHLPTVWGITSPLVLTAIALAAVGLSGLGYV
jgi:hypothetical protein